MRIGAVAKQAQLSCSTIRFYIDQGLLLPEKINGQYNFSENDVASLHFITMWKDMGFSLQEILHLTSLKRSSNWIELENFLHYSRLLEARKVQLEKDLTRVQDQIRRVDDELLSLENNELRRLHSGEAEIQGLPLSCLHLLACPICGRPLTLENAAMDYRYIHQCELNCACGYIATVKDGIVFAGEPRTDVEENPDILRAKYNNQSRELFTLWQRADHWLLPYLQVEKKPQVIVETRLNSFFFLYTFLKTLPAGDTVLLVDRFEEIMRMYKRYIELLNLDLHIVYLVNDNDQLPIRSGAADVLIDYCSSNNYNLYTKAPYLPLLHRLLKDSGHVIGAYFSLENAPASRQALAAAFPQAAPDNYRLNFFRKGLADHFHVERLERVGTVLDSGDCNIFDFHQSGEKLCLDCFVLAPLKKDTSA